MKVSAIVCDRCGTYLVDVPVANVTVRHTDPDTNKAVTTAKFDLCPACTEKLIKEFSAPQTEEPEVLVETTEN